MSHASLQYQHRSPYLALCEMVERRAPLLMSVGSLVDDAPELPFRGKPLPADTKARIVALLLAQQMNGVANLAVIARLTGVSLTCVQNHTRHMREGRCRRGNK